MLSLQIKNNDEILTYQKPFYLNFILIIILLTSFDYMDIFTSKGKFFCSKLIPITRASTESVSKK